MKSYRTWEKVCRFQLPHKWPPKPPLPPRCRRLRGLSMFTWMLASLCFRRLLGCLVPWLVGCLVAWFLGWSVAWLLGWLLGCLVGAFACFVLLHVFQPIQTCACVLFQRQNMRIQMRRNAHLDICQIQPSQNTFKKRFASDRKHKKK